MKVRIKTVIDGVLPSNLRRDVVYDAVRCDDYRMKVTCDDGQVIMTSIKKSGYLGNGGEWEVLSE